MTDTSSLLLGLFTETSAISRLLKSKYFQVMICEYNCDNSLDGIPRPSKKPLLISEECVLQANRAEQEPGGGGLQSEFERWRVWTLEKIKNKKKIKTDEMRKLPL